ncbi:MAG: SDR family NAD(P)-dependent oxidoreductase [Spirochaeta sp.]|jgi:short-subunit dehydrogenase|nr:SDR family NAD(P)-dependent oxidoreductase [Spirochaeta sp.]
MAKTTRKSRLTGAERHRLSNMAVVVTGSSRGIGRETARVLLDAGATVILNGRTAERLEMTETTLRAEFPAANLSTCAADISTAAGADRLAAHIATRSAGLDLLINNAGVSMRGPVRDLASKTITAIIDGNIAAALHATRACLPLITARRGHVTFVSTVGALHGFPGISVYAAAKAALQRFSESFNAEYRTVGLTAGVVYLGFVENDPDKEVYDAGGERFHHQRTAMQSQTEAAVAIVRASLRRRPRTITVKAGVLLDIAHRIAPRLVTRVLARNAGAIHSVERGSE